MTAEVEALRAEVTELRARLERVNPTPSKPRVESVERYLEMALNRMQNEPEPVKAASALFLQWCQQDSQVAKSLEAIIEEAVERRLVSLSPSQPASSE